MHVFSEVTKGIISLVAIFFFGNVLLTHPTLAMGEEINFRRIQNENGLSKNTVYSVLEDQKGFMWFGSSDGIDRFDGYKFKDYRSMLIAQTGLTSTHVYSMVSDDQGYIWLGMEEGLCRFDPVIEQFTLFKNIESKQDPSLSNDYVTGLLLDQEGQLWLGTRYGLSRFDKENLEFQNFSISSEGEKDERDKPQGLFQDSKGIIWLGVQNTLKLFNPKIGQFTDLPKPFGDIDNLHGKHVRVVIQDQSGMYWIGTEHAGVFVYDAIHQSVENLTTSNGLGSNMVRDIHPVSDSDIWIGTRNGLSVFNKKTNEISNHVYDKFNTASLSNNSVRKIWSDQQKNVWVATYLGGINIHHPTANNFYTFREELGQSGGLNHPVVGSVVADRDGNLWIGTSGGGLNYFDRSTGEFSYHVHTTDGNSLINDDVKALALDDLGNLWIGTFAGLSYLDTKTKKFENYQNPKDDLNFFRHNIVQCLLYSSDEGLWVGTNGGGLSLIDKSGKLQKYSHDPQDPNSLFFNNIQSIAKDDNGGLWVGTYKGLNYLDPTRKHVKRIFPPKVEGRLEVTSLHYSEGVLWIGSSRDVLMAYHIEKDVFSYFNGNDGFSGIQIRSILVDSDGDVWVGSGKGLSKLNVSKNKDGSIQLERITGFTKEDGLQGNQFKENSCYRASDGKLYFGGINGLNEFMPREIMVNKKEPSVYITEFFVKNKPLLVGGEGALLEKHISETEKISLAYDEAYFTVEVAALNYISSSKNQYAFKLEGLKQYEDWNYQGGQRTISFTGLAPGDYTLRIIASNNDGVWNNEGARLKIEVRPPYWKTWWAYLLYACLLAVLLYIYYYFSKSAFKLKQDLAIEHLYREKENELYQNKLRFFTNISHEIKTPLTLILTPIDNILTQNKENSKLQNQLMMMKRNGEHLTRLIKQLLDFRKLETGNMKLEMKRENIVPFLNEIFISFKGYAWQKNMDFGFQTDQDDIQAYIDKDKLEKIIYNLLSNAFKYTPEYGMITIKVGRSERQISLEDGSFTDGVEIRVEDNGKGIRKDALDSIFERFRRAGESDISSSGTGIGLAFTKELVLQHHGQINVTSREAENGRAGFTRFSVIIPTGGDHLLPEQIHQESKPVYTYSCVTEEGWTREKFEGKKGLILSGFSDEKPKLLVVEDNEDMRTLLIEYFSKDFDVFWVEDGKDGYEMAIKEIPDIIISDIMMPGMDGIELCAMIKKEELTSHIPMILLTARTPLLYKIEGLETGADDYITKPFNLNLLEVRVWNLLESRMKLRIRYQKEVVLKPENIAINSADEKFFEKVMKFIGENIAEPKLNVEELGKYVGMSRVHLYRKIKAKTGYSVVEFIRRARLQRAGQLLSDNELNVFEVSYMVGFLDQDYFRKCFKEFYGMTPSEYGTRNKRSADLKPGYQSDP
ncbi:two-component regulator propeller domain-containing protein [Belliella marina]|uniref:histidine kinase n=1 Tax=Belliella marina TaxID=1644146 RepID=A0ABW4VIX1_9BACT